MERKGQSVEAGEGRGQYRSVSVPTFGEMLLRSESTKALAQGMPSLKQKVSDQS